MAKVLVVDDSMMVRQQVARALKQAGFATLDAADGAEAVALVDTTPDISLVICDVNMPNRSGLEVLEVLAAETGSPKMPVVMLTTEGQHELIVRAKALGAKGWIVKPFKPEMLVMTAKKLTAPSEAVPRQEAG